MNWSQSHFGINDPNTSFYIGNQYGTFWADIMEVRDSYPINIVTFVLGVTGNLYQVQENPVNLVGKRAGKIWPC